MSADLRLGIILGALALIAWQALGAAYLSLRGTHAGWASLLLSLLWPAVEPHRPAREQQRGDDDA